MFGEIDPRSFLRRYWQKQPLLARRAVRGRFGLSGDVLAGLACEEDVESRLVLGSVARGFQLEHGPFAEKRFSRLPRQEWTLLVQDVDKHLPRAAALFDQVRFVPDWRVDDVMVSYAVQGGSVGPHVDAYDVFLVQLAGKRRWQLSAQTDLALCADAELKLLERFLPEVEHVLGPGDVLYLPPGVAHFGVAESECLTASVGFRAPSQDELLSDFLQEVAAQAEETRYADPDLRPSVHASELRSGELARLRQLVRDGITVPDARIDDFIGRYLTRLKAHFEAALTSGEHDDARTRRLLQNPAAMARRRHGSRWLYFAAAGGPHWFVNGERLEAPKRAAAALRKLAEGQAAMLEELGAALCAQLVRLGALELSRASSSRRPARRSAASRRAR
jgi:50S ribosomal protein L16 3-hydroxylase